MVKDKNTKYREKSRAREKAKAAYAISIGISGGMKMNIDNTVVRGYDTQYRNLPAD